MSINKRKHYSHCYEQYIENYLINFVIKLTIVCQFCIKEVYNKSSKKTKLMNLILQCLK